MYMQTEEEYQNRNLCYSMSDVAPTNRTITKTHPKHLPESVDWRTKGAVSGVKDQVNTLVIRMKVSEYQSSMYRVSVAVAMHSVQWEDWKEHMH